MKRRQRLSGFNLGGTDKLGDEEVANAPVCVLRVDIRHGRIRRAQVHTHDIATGSDGVIVRYAHCLSQKAVKLRGNSELYRNYGEICASATRGMPLRLEKRCNQPRRYVMIVARIQL